MKRTIITTVASIFAAIASIAHAEDLSAVEDAIREADQTSIVYAAVLIRCESALYSEHRDLWVAHRTLLTFGLEDLMSTRDAALVRFDELRDFAATQEPITDTGMCLSALDMLQADLDIANAKLREAVRSN